MLSIKNNPELSNQLLLGGLVYSAFLNRIGDDLSVQSEKWKKITHSMWQVEELKLKGYSCDRFQAA